MRFDSSRHHVTHANNDLGGVYAYEQDGVLYGLNGQPYRPPSTAPNPSVPPHDIPLTSGGLLPSLIGGPQLDRMVELARMTPPDGDFCEVGVYQGGSAARLLPLARDRGVKLWLYDTFTGIPYAGAHDSHRVGDFADTNLNVLQARLPECEFRPGIFPASADPAMRRVSFVHLDVDQYQSYCDAIRYLLPLLLPGAIMVFDDYHALASAKRAIDEMLPGLVNLTDVRAHYIHKG